MTIASGMAIVQRYLKNPIGDHRAVGNRGVNSSGGPQRKPTTTYDVPHSISQAEHGFGGGADSTISLPNRRLSVNPKELHPTSSYETAWYLLQRFRRAMVNDSRSPLAGVVEADETIVGGPAKGKTGRGTTKAEHKSLVLGTVEVLSYKDKHGKNRKRAGRVRLQLAQRADAVSIEAFLRKNLALGVQVRTDGWKGYSENALKGYRHIAAVQDSPESASRLAPHIHRVFANLKTWLLGTHHGVEPKYLQGYLDEYVFRFNRRQTPMAAFQTLLGITVAKKPRTMENLRLGESTG
jgi:hypothetical protein